MSLASNIVAKFGTAALVAGLTAIAAPAFAVDCGSTYTVQRGDTLSGIAKRAYGSTGTFQIIYSANADAIGPNPALINVGARLDIPCLGNVQASRADSSACLLYTSDAADD